MTKSIWEKKPELAEMLKALWNEKKSAAEIAAALGNGVSRSGVLAKASRMRAAGVDLVANPLTGGPRQRPSRARQPVQPPEPVDTAEVTPLRLPDGALVTLATLTNRMCKWGHGEPQHPGFHFCGRPNDGGKSFCKYHHRIAYIPINHSARAQKLDEVQRGDVVTGIHRIFG